MSVPGTDLLGVMGGAKILKVVVPTFTTRNIGQSNSSAGSSTNVITVTLQANVEVAVESVVTISGLAGATISSTPITLTGTDRAKFLAGCEETETGCQELCTVSSITLTE
jgi:hypothetical protein